jgi:hypothetical protein
MLERVHLLPARSGLVVADPDHGGLPLPPEGREVGLSSYWIRRLEDGDVVRKDAEAKAPRAPKTRETK